MATTNESSRDTYHHGSLKEACLEQGMALLKEVGLEKFSLREVARRVGVTPTALYHHFPNKNDLLAELAEIGVSRFQETFEPLLQTNESPVDRLLKLVNAYLGFFEERQFFLDIMYATASDEYPGWRNVRDRLFPLVLKNLRDIGIPEKDIPFVAVWSWSAVHGMATLEKAGVFGRTETEGPNDPGVRTMFYTNPAELRQDALPVLVRMIEGYAKARPQTNS